MCCNGIVALWKIEPEDLSEGSSFLEEEQQW